MKRQKYQGLFLAAVFVSMLWGGPVAGEKVKVTWLTTMWKINEQFHQAIVDEFNNMQNHIVVEMEPIASNAQQADAILMRVAAGTPPDMVDFHPNYFYSFVKGGILQDLNPLLTRDPGFNLADFYKPVMDSVTVNGKLYAIPQRISYYHLYYNVDYFQSAGVKVPAADWQDKAWNWDAYRQAADKLSRDANGDGVFDQVGGVFSSITGQIVYWLAQGGASLFDAGYTKLTLNTPAAIDTMRYLAEGMTRGVMRWGVWNDFAAGKSAMLNETPAVIQLIRQANMAYNWEVAALPQGPAGPATALQPVPYALIASSQHQNEAAEFFRYLFSREGSARQSAAGIIVQPRRSVVTSSAFQSGLGLKNSRAVIQALDFATPIPSNNMKFVDISNAISNMIRTVASGQSAPAAAVAAIESNINALLAEGR